MSTDTALTMEELELEQAELLPSRETLCYWNPCRYSHSCNSYCSYNSYNSCNPCYWYNPCHPHHHSCW